MEHLWKADLGDGTFQNPVLFADYSDPDAIRVEDTYYMTASSFNYIPGLPILTSKDLVNWKLENYALDRIDYDRYDIPQHSKGVWAPAIRYHEGEFYIYYGMPDEGIFMVKTKDPLGKWEKPVMVLEGKGLIDSCPFWDEDGKAYIVHGYAKSRIGFKSYLGIFPMSWDGKCAIGEDHLLFNGVETQPTIEGPKVYKRNGYYYIMAPAGGVKQGWQTVLRSRSIYGPYEEKIVMRQGNTSVNGPHQGALVDTVSGEEWFLHFQDRGLYGRVVHLQPVVWENDWPVVGVNAKDGCGEPCLVHKKPSAGGAQEPCSLEASDDFQDGRLNLLWQWMGNAREDFYSLSARPGYLRLYALNPSKKKPPVLWECANVLTQKLVCPYFRAETFLETGGLSAGQQAGMVMMGGQYAYIGVRVLNGKKQLVLGREVESREGVGEEVVPLADLSEKGEGVFLIFYMKEGAEGPEFSMAYALEEHQEITVETDFMPSDHTWVGSKIGLYATDVREEAQETGEQTGYGDFAYLHVTRQ